MDLTRRHKLQALINEYANKNMEPYLRKDLRSISFEGDAALFSQISNLFKKLAKIRFEFLSETNVVEIERMINQLGGQLIGIMNLDIGQSNLPQMRQTVGINIYKVWDACFTVLSKYIVLQDETEFDKLREEFRENFKEAMQEVKGELKKELPPVVQARTEAEAAAASVKEQAAGTGVIQSEVHFSNSVDLLRSESCRWLSACIIFAAFITGFGIYLHQNKIENAHGVEYWVNGIMPRLVVLSVLSFCLGWSAKNFLACKHNIIVNQHRHNCLGTFNVLRQGAHSEATKDAILQAATKAIFDQQPSGYAKTDADGTQNPPLIEIFKNFVQKSKD